MAQVNFFMDERDEADFFAMLQARGDTALHLGRFFSTPEPPVARRLPRFGTRRACVLTNSVITPSARCQARGAGELAGKYCFDLFRDLHIDVDRCHRQGDILVSGRLYAKIGWLESAEQNRKGNAWYGSLSRWIRSRYRRVRDVWFVGPSAEAWSIAGGRLAYGDPNALAETLASRR